MAEAAAEGTSLQRVVIDSIDMHTLAKNVMSHLLHKDEQVSEQLEKSGASKIHTLSDICDDGDGTGVPDEAVDEVDFPGTGLPVDGHRSKVQKVSNCLLEIADELDQREDIWELVKSLDITADTAYDTFAAVAMEIFRHGVSWGKIAVLFVFAAQCVMRAILAEVPNIFMILAKFVATFIGERLQKWIVDSGGWGSLTSGKSGSTIKIVGIVAVSLIAGFALKSLWDRW